MPKAKEPAITFRNADRIPCPGARHPQESKAAVYVLLGADMLPTTGCSERYSLAALAHRGNPPTRDSGALDTKYLQIVLPRQMQGILWVGRGTPKRVVSHKSGHQSYRPILELPLRDVRYAVYAD